MFLFLLFKNKIMISLKDIKGFGCFYYLQWELTFVEEILVAGDIVAYVVLGLPAPKQRKSWPQLQLHKVVVFLEVTGGDVSNLVPVINISGCRRKNSL